MRIFHVSPTGYPKEAKNQGKKEILLTEMR